MKEQSDFAQFYFEYYTKPEKSRTEDEFARICSINDAIASGSEQGWEWLQRLIEQGPSDLILALVSAGPFEDLLCLHGPEFIERVEIQARKSPRFRKALRAVWGENRMDRTVRERVEKACATEPKW